MSQVKDLVDAIDAFITGSKADGTWNAIKASCIMAGWDNLNGALTPLAGTAPTNFNFVSADYDRKTGLVGDGSTKYLDSNRNNNADPQDSKHISIYLGISLSSGSATFRSHLGLAPGASVTGSSVLATDGSTDAARHRVNGATPAIIGSSAGLSPGFHGANRSTSSQITSRIAGVLTSTASTSETRANANFYVFARNLTPNPGFAEVDSYSNARLAFYSIGEALDLAALDTRVSNLITAIGAAIP